MFVIKPLTDKQSVFLTNCLQCMYICNYKRMYIAIDLVERKLKRIGTYVTPQVPVSKLSKFSNALAID